MLDKRTVITTIEQYASAVTREFDPAAIILYGSYAQGTAHKDSDIDVVVIFEDFTGDWLKTSSRLWYLTEDISFDIEPILADNKQDKAVL